MAERSRIRQLEAARGGIGGVGQGSATSVGVNPRRNLQISSVVLVFGALDWSLRLGSEEHVSDFFLWVVLPKLPRKTHETIAPSSAHTTHLPVDIASFQVLGMDNNNTVRS